MHSVGRVGWKQRRFNMGEFDGAIDEFKRAYELARRKVATFVGAGSASEIVFTRNATESINLVASSFGRQFVKAGDTLIEIEEPLNDIRN